MIRAHRLVTFELGLVYRAAFDGRILGPLVCGADHRRACTISCEYIALVDNPTDGSLPMLACCRSSADGAVFGLLDPDCDGDELAELTAGSNLQADRRMARVLAAQGAGR
jgi:hypothetical protein